MVLGGKFSQLYSFNAEIVSSFILCPTLRILLMTFQVMLLIILLSVLIILLNMIRHLIRGNDWSWLLNLNLTYETLDWGRKQPVDFSGGKIQFVLFDWFNSLCY